MLAHVHVRSRRCLGCWSVRSRRCLGCWSVVAEWVASSFEIGLGLEMVVEKACLEIVEKAWKLSTHQ